MKPAAERPPILRAVNDAADKNAPSYDMPFLHHLAELRQRLIRSLIAVGVGLSICYPFADKIFALLVKPLFGKAEHPPKLIYTTPMEVFVAFFKLAFVAGLILSVPYIFYQLWGFVSPGLRDKEKRYVWPFVFFTSSFFLFGLLFGYFVALPAAYDFLLGYAPAFVEANIRVADYLSFTTQMLLVFGLVFETPLLLLFLIHLRILNTRQIIRQWRGMVVGIFAVAAVVTPTTDAVSMLVMAVPLLLLFAISVVFGWLLERRRKSNDSSAKLRPAG